MVPVAFNSGNQVIQGGVQTCPKSGLTQANYWTPGLLSDHKQKKSRSRDPSPARDYFGSIGYTIKPGTWYGKNDRTEAEKLSRLFQSICYAYQQLKATAIGTIHLATRKRDYHTFVMSPDFFYWDMERQWSIGVITIVREDCLVISFRKVCRLRGAG